MKRACRGKFTIQGLMIVIAIGGLILAAEQFRRISQSSEQRAAWHAMEEATACGKYCSLYIDFDDDNCWQRISQEDHRRHDGPLYQPPDRSKIYHHQMQHKWRRASCLPWISVEPDPPHP